MMRSTVQNPDIYFQVREANNGFYDALPGIVEDYMAKISEITGREYHLFNYYGAPDAEEIVIAMGSVSGAAEEAVDYLNAQGRKTGYVQVHLFRPFSVEHLSARFRRASAKSPSSTAARRWARTAGRSIRIYAPPSPAAE